MRWRPRGRSRNLEDRRAETGGRRRSGSSFPFPSRQGGARRLPMPRSGGGRLGLGGLLLLLVVIFLLRPDLGLLGEGGLTGPTGTRVPLPSESRTDGQPPVSASGSAEEERLVDFVSFVLDDLQETWSRILPGYQDTRLVLFRDAIRSACGFAEAASGPFYCPLDRKVYIDLGFYEELHRRFGAPGDFAQAYVLAHEVGHHVQTLTGVAEEVRRAQRTDARSANDLSVRMELQADCLAGVWAHSTHRRGLLEDGDVEEGLRAAAAIGDDRIQRMSQGRVVPEAFTHGSSRQRAAWLRRGLQSGDANACNVFAVPEP